MTRRVIYVWQVNPDDPDALRCDERTCSLKAEWEGEYSAALGSTSYLASCDRHLVEALRGAR